MVHPDPEGDDLRADIEAAEAVLREPMDFGNIWAWMNRRNKALDDWLRAREWLRLTGPLGAGIICKEAARVKVVPFRDGGEIFHRVIGCAVNNRCNCQEVWDRFWRMEFKLSRDPQAAASISRMLSAQDAPDGGIQLEAVGTAKEELVALGYPREVANWAVNKVIEE